MQLRVNCKTQAECDAALAAKNLPVLVGDGRFTIRGESYVEARESSHVVASKFVATHIHSKESKVKGGVQIVVKAPTNPKDWCEYYGAKVEKGFAILFKAVSKDF